MVDSVVDVECWASSVVAVAAAAIVGVGLGVVLALKDSLEARRKSLRACLSGSILIPKGRPAATSLGRTCLGIAWLTVFTSVTTCVLAF